MQGVNGHTARAGSLRPSDDDRSLGLGRTHQIGLASGVWLVQTMARMTISASFFRLCPQALRQYCRLASLGLAFLGCGSSEKSTPSTVGTGGQGAAGLAGQNGLPEGTGGQAGGAGSGGYPQADLDARMAGFSRGVNVDRWLLNPITEDASTYVTATDMQLLKDLGLDHVRILVHLEQTFVESTPSVLDPAGLAELDAGIALALDHGLNVIVDLHCTDPMHWERYSYRLENEPGFIDTFSEFWAALAGHLTRYDPDRLLLQPMNEPMFEGREADWLPMQEQLVASIRAAAPDHTILAVPALWQSHELLVELEPLADDNIVYDFHYYVPSVFIFQGYYRDADPGWSRWVAQSRGLPYPVVPGIVDSLVEHAPSPDAASLMRQYGAAGWNANLHAENVASVRRWADQHQVPVICTEFGADAVFMTEADQLAYVRDVREALDRSAIPWTYYDYDQGYGIVRRGQGKTALDAPLVEALGLDLDATSVPRYSLALSPESLSACDQGMLDDLEDGDDVLRSQAEPGGQWHVVVDAQGSTVNPTTFVPTAGGAEQSAYAASVAGTIGLASGDAGWELEAGLLVALDGPLDASLAQGVSFWAKGEGTIDVVLRDDSSTHGTGRCTDCTPFYAPLRLTGEWTQYTILFTGLQQSPYWGDQSVLFDPRSLRSIAWLNQTPGKEFEIWVDDLRLVGCQ